MPFGKGQFWAAEASYEEDPRAARAASYGNGPAGWGKSAPSSISTMHVSGWPLDCTDREMENYCRFFPGFVAAKANLKGQPKLWVRFDCPASALQAIPAIDGQPFDWRDEEVLLWASVAKTDLNPDRMGRPKGPYCVAGCIDDLIGGLLHANSTWSMQAAADAQAGKGALPALTDSGAVVKKPDSLEAAAPWHHRSEPVGSGPWPKRARLEGMVAEEDIDTVVVLRPADAGLSDLGLHEFFLQVEGYVALRMGGANCFVKFQAPSYALAAVTAACNYGLQAAVAKTNMNASQATHFAEAPAQEANG